PCPRPVCGDCKVSPLAPRSSFSALSVSYRRQLAQLCLQMLEVDRLGYELRRAEFSGTPTALIIAVRCYHHDGQIGKSSLDVSEQFKSVHAGHIDVREDGHQCGLDLALEPIQRLRARSRKVHHIGSLAGLTAKALPEEFGHVGFVVDHQYAYAHAADLGTVLRGN